MKNDRVKYELDAKQGLFGKMYLAGSQPMLQPSKESPCGYCKNLKKKVKTGQTRTLEQKSMQRARRKLSKVKNGQLKSTFVHSEEAQPVTITDCHVGNPCEQRSDPTALRKHPMIRGMKGRDREERVTDFGA
ncbi:hypothetical protein Tco_0256243 [Tanacetum coccineum]